MKLSYRAISSCIMILLLGSVQAQETLRITYMTTPYFDPPEQGDFTTQDMYAQMNNMISGFEFELLVKDDKARFQKTGGFYEGASDDMLYLLALGFSGGDEVWYTERDNPSKHIYKRDLEGEITLDLSETVTWKIGSERKTIGAYEAIRATTTRQKASFTQEIEVWFSPEVPQHFGPFGYNGLPGLILEMKWGRVTFHLKEIAETDESVRTPAETKRRMSFEKYYQLLEEERQAILSKER